MNPLAQILADNDSNIVKVLFGAVFLVIWAVSALMSMLAKKKEQERRDRVRREIELGRSMPPPMQQGPMQPPPMMRPPPRVQQAPPRPVPRPAPPPRTVARPAPRPQQQQPKKRFPVKAPAARPPAVPVGAYASQPVEAEILVEPMPAASPMTSASKRRTAAPSGAALNAWLKPATLRQQFILTEVLQPPVAMRPERT